MTIDNHDLESFASVAAAFGTERYGFVVTPNVDHFIRYADDAAFQNYYGDAAYVLLDSRFLARLLKLFKGLSLPVCAGSDLTLRLFKQVIAPTDRILMIGGSAEQAAKVRERFGLQNLQHHNPPMGFIRDPQAVAQCEHFITAHSPFRFCFVAVGSPQQEILAQRLKQVGTARGLVLCVGASINFITGEERRAPMWMQRSGIEWLYRLLQDPRRLAKRYLVRGPRIFPLLSRMQVRLRNVDQQSVAGPHAASVDRHSA